MTDQTNTGGAAFPVSYEGGNNNGESPFLHQGMTLRDYFAAKAMEAIIAKIPLSGTKTDESTCKNVTATKRSLQMEQIANGAYLYADAMLAARGGAK